MHRYWVYIMSNKYRTILYIGVTNDLYRRYIEHKQGRVDGFTKKYNCHDLVYFEEYQDINEAIAREKSLKGILRQKKEELIKSINPLMRNLADDFEW